MESRKQKEKKIQKANEKWLKESKKNIKPEIRHPWRKINNDMEPK